MSEELVRINGVLPSQDEVKSQLARVEEKGGADALLEVADQARAYQEYEKRNHAKERADHFGKVQVLAEARIGLIDLKQYRYMRGTEFIIGGESMTRGVRQKWRLLGGSSQAGVLDDTITEVAREFERSVTTSSVFYELYFKGWSFIDPKPLRKRYLALKAPGRPAKGEGIQARLAAVLGCTPQDVSHYLRAGGNPRIPLATALRLADALEVPYSELRPVRRRRKPARRRMRKQRQLPGGRLDETYSLIRRALQQLDRATGQSDKWGTAEAWEHLHQAEEIVGKALKRAA